MLRIVIDLTPILPGGENGGAKIMSLQLIKQLAILAPENTYTLLASKNNFDELSLMKTSNIGILCVERTSFTIHTAFIFLTSACFWPAIEAAKYFKLNRVTTRLQRLFHKIRNYLTARDLAKILKPDLLFCPFTAPFYHGFDIPIVSVIYDLQSQYYPHFFTASERFERKKHFHDACYWSTKLICISDYVKQTVIDNSKVLAENLKTIYIRLADRLPKIEKESGDAILNRYGVTEGNFLLFPANFWVHKNHTVLLTAFNMYCHQNPLSTLKLVCTGSNNNYKLFLIDAIKKMGLESSIIMPGFLSDEEFAGFVSGCSAIIFPSLYEGFGMPAVEAMAAGKPVLCSNTTSLPEIVESAALQFDPRKPQEIVDAIYRIAHEPELAERLIKLGYDRVNAIGTVNTMATEYLETFNEAIACKQN